MISLVSDWACIGEWRRPGIRGGERDGYIEGVSVAGLSRYLEGTSVECGQ